MKIIEILKARLVELHAQRAAAITEMEAIPALASSESRSTLTADEDVAFAAAEAIVRGLDPEIDTVEGRIAELTKIAERTAAAAVGAASRRPIVPGARDVPTVEETRGMTSVQLEDAATRALEARGVEDVTHARKLYKAHSRQDGGLWVRQMLIRSSDAYASAFTKMLTGRQWEMTNLERSAIAVGTNTQGGFLVPTHLDPTVVLSNSGVSNAVRAMARVESLVGANTWHGISSDGVTASWDGEIVEVSDDSPSFAGPSISTFRAAAFVQASFEFMEDAATDVGSMVLMMFADARERLEAAAHCTGGGSTAPTGIFTALDANTNVEVVSATAAAIALADLTGLRRAVPVRFRSRSKWLMNPKWADSIKALGTAMSASYSTDITQAGTTTLLGSPLVESDEAPSVNTTTIRDNLIVVGDFSSYVVVDKVGSTAVQYIPTLFNTTTNLPDGRSGWYISWRSGADSILDTAFRLLQDATSA